MALSNYLQIFCILPLIVNGGIFHNLLKQSCDFDRLAETYICTKITEQFPKMYYGEYNLHCHYCDIEVFTNETFPYKNRLRVFNGSQSRINTISSKAFENLKYLEEIHLENNLISKIEEDAFFGLRRLFQLHLENNQISVLIPGFLNECESNAVILNHNNLIAIPNEAFRGLYTVLILDLSYNSISSLEEDALKHINGLEILDLQFNELCSVPIGVFKHVRNVRTLNLAYNKFTSFPLGLFSPFKDLVNLNLSHNHLKSFASEILLPLRRIELLDISANLLNDLDAVALKRNSPITFQWIVLNDNFWLCSRLTSIIQYLKSNRIEISDYGVQRYDLININGIVCTDTKLSGESMMDLAIFLKTVDSAAKTKQYCASKSNRR